MDGKIHHTEVHPTENSGRDQEYMSDFQLISVGNRRALGVCEIGVLAKEVGGGGVVKTFLVRLVACHTSKFLHFPVQVLNWFNDDVIKWKYFPRYCPFVRGIHRFSLICAWIIGWLNHRKVGDLRRHHAQYDVTVILLSKC